MNIEPLSTALKGQASQLSECFHCSLGEETYSHRHFGNATLTLEGQIRFRFIRDRGEIFIDVAVKDGPWLQAATVLERIGVSASTSDIDFIIDELCRNRDRVRANLLGTS